LLGSAIEDAGGVTAALGNSDLGFTSSAARQMRPAAIVVMDTEGTVALGSVSAELLTLDFTAPYGLRTDTDELYEQMRTLAPKLAANKPSLLVIDPGDLYRAQASRPESSILAAEANWNDALGTLDDIYAQASEIFADATIIVAAQAAVSPTLGREGLGPLIITQPSGADREEELVSSDANSAGQEGGLLSSDATQRAGLVTNLDLSATIYALLEIPAPLEVIGSPIYSRSTDIDRYEFLRRSNNTALSVDAMRARVINPIIWTTVILLCAGAFVLMWAQTHWRSSTIKRVRELLEIGILGCLSVPAASWFMFLIDRWPQSPNQVVAQLIAAAVVLWIVALIIWRLFGGTTGIIFLGAITSLVIIIDQLLGAPFSFSAIFSYSPIMAFRFYGLGNEGAALLFGASVMAFVLWLEQSAHPKRYTTWVLAIGAFLIMLVCAAPWWGANVGVAIWATVGFAVLFLLINDKKITWQNLLIMGIAIVLILGVFIALDRFGSGGETHLARAVDSAERGGIAPLIEIVARKAQTNLRVLTASMWGVVFVAVIGFMLLMRFRPSPELTRTLEANRFFADGMTALLVAGIVAFFTEDSGIVLPAIMVLYLGGALLWLMLDRMNVEDLEGE
ncbi:MAG: hypothetical protein FWD41_04115, partial [Actinomycetia bacterium]|nr:hypothetical protein [Actinomycetes bacterium]